MSSVSSGGDVGKRRKRSRSVLPVEGGEDTQAKGSRSVLPVEEADQRDNAEGGKVTLKKGTWTKEEDEILVDHIKKYGGGNWDRVQKNSGLARDGKSCRLRWANHLRPGLIKGAFTDEEEHKIVEFHFRKGSKWAQMAALLPGRTDNEIKNFWYTRSKKRQRAGLPIYPDEISNGSQEIGDALANESSQRDEFNLDITDLDLKDFKFYPNMLPPCFDTQDYKLISDLLGPCSDPSYNTLSTLRAAVTRCRYLISSSNAAVPDISHTDQYDQYGQYPMLSTPDQYDRYGQYPMLSTPDQYGQYPMLSTPCDPILNTNIVHGYDNPITGFHATPYISPSEPIYESMSVEPPSFQNSQTQQCTSSSMYMSQLPSFEPVDTPVQAPPTEPCLPVPVPPSPDCSHLIDSSVHYNSDQNLKSSCTDSLQANTDSLAPNEADISTQRNGQNYNQQVALNPRELHFLKWVCQPRNFYRWVRSGIETTQG